MVRGQAGDFSPQCIIQSLSQQSRGLTQETFELHAKPLRQPCLPADVGGV